MLNPIPGVFLSDKANVKLWEYARLATAEVGGLGEVTQMQNGELLISDLFLFEQTTSEVETSLDPIALGKFMAETIRTGYDRSKLRLWWHSHGWGQVFWSGQDQMTINGLLNCLPKDTYFLSIVVNKLAQNKARIDYPLSRTSDEILLQRKMTGDGEIDRQELYDEVARKVTFTSDSVR